ncbi:MAG: sulfatase-like hydrolase/transferase, partial [Gammaproteobacteria bacterium]|nr:sulfatase-like hydrolase/transferase [Gammaproteobacteria bacterium]
TYLQRHDVHVIWRSKNWGEPPIRVDSYRSSGKLRKFCETNCKYDEVLLTGLAEEIRVAGKNRIFVILHLKGSHGPKYSKRYPNSFEIYRPVCLSVELQECTLESLVNAYDNSIAYTDHFLGRVVDLLQQFDDRPTMMMYLSDHGESLGEGGLYLHGAPYALAPAEQKEIPFLLWMSERFVAGKNVSIDQLRSQPKHSQVNVFHSMLNAFDLQSEVYREQLDIFSPGFTDEP